MLQFSAMKATRRSSTASSDAEKIREDHVGDKLGGQNNIVNIATSPLRSAQNSKSEFIQQTRRASPRRADLEVERRTGADFDREMRRFDGRRPTSYVENREAGGFESRDHRGRSSDRQGLNQRQINYYRSQERAQPGNANEAQVYLRNFVDDRQAAYNQDMRTDSMGRSKSLGRYPGKWPNSDRYDQDYCDDLRPSRYFPSRHELMDRNSEIYNRRSNYSRQNAYAREDILGDQRRFYRDQSLRRRSQSVGRYESDRMSRRHFGRYQVEEPQHGTHRYEIARSTGRFAHPSRERGNRYFEVRRFDETDGKKYFRKEMFLQTDGQLDLNRTTLDHSGFDRRGLDDFGYERYLN